MKRTYHFVDSIGMATCTLPSGEALEIPLVPGILKHPEAKALAELLQDPDSLRKYTVEALRRAPWNVVKQFPVRWLERCMRVAELPPGRKKALIFMLSIKPDADETPVQQT